jgi:hypothetical protein
MFDVAFSPVKTNSRVYQYRGKTQKERDNRTSNVLFASLKSETVGGTSLRILRETDEATGHPPLEAVLAGEEGGVRSSVTHGNTKTSSVSEGDIGSPFARRLEGGEGEEVGGDSNESSEIVGALSDCFPVSDFSSNVRVLKEDADEVLVLILVARLVQQLADVADDDVDAERFRTSANDGDGLREDAAVDEESLALLAKVTERHDHALGRRCSLVEERSIRDIEPGEGGCERLEVDEGFEPALRDLGLST